MYLYGIYIYIYIHPYKSFKIIITGPPLSCRTLFFLRVRLAEEGQCRAQPATLLSTKSGSDCSGILTYIWYMIYDVWYMIYDIWYMIYDIWYENAKEMLLWEHPWNFWKMTLAHAHGSVARARFAFKNHQTCLERSGFGRWGRQNEHASATRARFRFQNGIEYTYPDVRSAFGTWGRQHVH